MKSKDKKYYKLIIMAYYMGEATDVQILAVKKSFEYFNSETINYIIESKFNYNKTIKNIKEHSPEKLSTCSINNRIDMFLEELRYQLK
ncbi:MAG: hypothetical protein ACK5NF_03235 [Bacilli bacterium]